MAVNIERPVLTVRYLNTFKKENVSIKLMSKLYNIFKYSLV
tara:strand:- start:931 stop:1053 length:123 start_codon:yes stop_codon:yes gene_type:complete